MNKTDLIKAVYEETGISKKDGGSVVNSTFDVISNYLAEEGQERA